MGTGGRGAALGGHFPLRAGAAGAAGTGALPPRRGPGTGESDSGGVAQGRGNGRNSMTVKYDRQLLLQSNFNAQPPARARTDQKY